MSTVTRFVQGSGKQADNVRCAAIIDNVIDFSDLEVASGDVVNCLVIPAGTLVLGVGLRVLTAEGAAATATVGDTDTANKYLSAQNLNATTTDAAATTGVGNPVYYKDENHITLTPNAALDAAKVHVWALVVPVLRGDD